MENQNKVLTLKDVAEHLKGNMSDVLGFVDSGLLPVFSLGNEVRTTQQSVDEMVAILLKKATNKQIKVIPKPKDDFDGDEDFERLVLRAKLFPPNPEGLLKLPSIWEINRINPVLVKYRPTVGLNIKHLIKKSNNDYPHYEYNVEVNRKNVPITVVIFGPEGGYSKKGVDPLWGAEVHLGKWGEGMIALNEWRRTADYATSKRLASPIKMAHWHTGKDGSMRAYESRWFAKAGEPIDHEYKDLSIMQYNDVIGTKNMLKCQSVVCKEDNHGPMVLHALIRARLNGLMNY
jgi:hypothetical protein